MIWQEKRGMWITVWEVYVCMHVCVCVGGISALVTVSACVWFMSIEGVELYLNECVHASVCVRGVQRVTWVDFASGAWRQFALGMTK